MHAFEMTQNNNKMSSPQKYTIAKDKVYFMNVLMNNRNVTDCPIQKVMSDF